MRTTGHIPKKRPGPLPRPVQRGPRAVRSLQGGADRVKFGDERGADAVQGGDDGNRNPGGNQAVFNGCGAGFVLQKSQNKQLHGGSTSVSVPGTRSSPAVPKRNLKLEI